KIIEGAKQVKIFGENLAVRAKVVTIGGFSAHADQNDLLEWVGNFESKPRVFLVHGEETASQALALRIMEKFDLAVHVPRWKERLILEPRQLSFEEPEGVEPLPDMKTLMLNSIAELENELEMLKQRMKSKGIEEKIGEEEIDRLKYVREELGAILS
ncbi:MAG TPA: MBL fold metallo-hydrolase RNA specificity domain-containing protein, partial [Acidobacteriota bacterium]|nr:MBL fold metallo-hydrolase RNA specificity domain-containing protein [Acidobacteriota bacterium]